MKKIRIITFLVMLAFAIYYLFIYSFILEIYSWQSTKLPQLTQSIPVHPFSFILITLLIAYISSEKFRELVKSHEYLEKLLVFLLLSDFILVAVSFFAEENFAPVMHISSFYEFILVELIALLLFPFILFCFFVSKYISGKES
jgi:hypothetical protein